jgi:hypothetical protein
MDRYTDVVTENIAKRSLCSSAIVRPIPVNGVQHWLIGELKSLINLQNRGWNRWLSRLLSPSFARSADKSL